MAIPPQSWHQNYVPTLDDWLAALLCDGVSIPEAMSQKLDTDNGTSTNQTLDHPIIKDGTIIINGAKHALNDLLSSAGTANSTMALAPTVEDAMRGGFPSTMTTLVVGARSQDSDAALAQYKRVSSEPIHPGKFQSADGQWWELCSEFVTPEMLSSTSVGYRVGQKGYDTASDDTQALQDCIDVALTLAIPIHLHGKWYRHNTPLHVQPLKGTSNANIAPDHSVITQWSTVNAPQLVIMGFGNAGLIAGSPMKHQISVSTPVSLGNNAQPQWCRFENVKFDGDNQVSGANLYLEWSGNCHILNCGFSRAGTGIAVSGYGVFLIQHCDIGGRYFCIDVQRGGDATITDCDLFVQSIGANIAGNIKFTRNIVTGTGYGTISNPRIGVILNPVGTLNGESFPYSYGVRIDANEFFALDAAVYGDASSSGFYAICQISITNNHALGAPTSNSDIVLVNLNSARNIYIAGNQINRDVAAISNSPALYFTSCDTIHISDNDLNNIANSAIIARGCTNMSIHHNTLTNIGCMSNYLMQSETLSSSVWSTTNLTLGINSTAVPTGTILYPNGARLTLLSDTQEMGAHGISQSQDTNTGASYTLSAIVCASTLSKVMLCPYTQGVGARFDLSSGAVSTLFQGYDGGIINLQNNYYRLWCTLISAPGTNATPGLYLLNQEGEMLYRGAGQGLFAGAFMWNIGQSAGNYNAPTLTKTTGGEAPIILTDSFQCVVESCQLLQKYHQSLPVYLVAETGSSNYNGIYRNNIPDNVIPFYQIGSSSFFENWERSAFRATSSMSQIITASSIGQLSFPVISSNRGNKFSGNTYSPGQGIAAITAAVAFSGATTGAVMTLSIYKNGTAFSASSRPAIASSDALSVTIEDEVEQGDYYQVFFYNGGSSSITIRNDSTLTSFTGRCH